MKNLKTFVMAIVATMLATACSGESDVTTKTATTTSTAAPAAAVESFDSIPRGNGERCSVAWSHYIGWEVAHYIQESGIADKWSKRKNVELKYVFLPEYVGSIEQATIGEFDAVTATTIDTLTLPVFGGVETEVLVIGDYSNGNDAILVIDPSGSINSLADLPKGTTVYLVEYSISDYLFERALQSVNMGRSHFNIVNTSDADIGGIFEGADEGAVAVTWNPIVMSALESVPGARSIYDSSSIPGEILDAVITHADTSSACKAAIAGSWYEGFRVMSGNDAAAATAVKQMAEFAYGENDGSVDVVGWFDAQRATTQFFYNPADGVAVANSNDLKQATEFVRSFAFDVVLVDEGVDADTIGIAFPDGTVLGNPNNVLMRFNDEFMKRAAAGQL